MNNKCFFIWLAAAVVTVLLRVYQIISLTEYDTGFIRLSSKITAVALFVLFFLIAIFSSLFAYLSAKGGNKSKSLPPVSAAAALILGVTLIISIFSGGYSGVPAVLSAVYIFFGLLSAVYFLAFALRAVFAFPLSAKFSAVPLTFFVLKSAIVFIRSSFRTAMSDTLFEIGAYCFTMLLFLEIARSANGLSEKPAVKKFSAIGVAASLFLAGASLPRIIVHFVYSFALHDGIGDSVFLLALCLFVASLVFTRVRFTDKEPRKPRTRYTGKHSA